MQGGTRGRHEQYKHGTQKQLQYEVIKNLQSSTACDTSDDFAHLRGTNILVKKTAPPTGGHVFQRLGTTFELNQDIVKTNILTKLHEDWHEIFDPAQPCFELGRDFIGTKFLTKFHEDGTRNQMLTDGRTYHGQRPVTKAHLSNQVVSLNMLSVRIQDHISSVVLSNVYLMD
ncbi:hypothetical protein DPMN_122031 [Dreissena polymorpha]|uniref:Uncharacterized protein n=1 Tax=Dreissena polymorpha TaxID=45954 RepID=A0A9D4GNL6_DREPO|nr:hypothetical protein DPMN_122031 [Dreissena polymorpha]